jgi:ribosomal protein L24E
MTDPLLTCPHCGKPIYDDDALSCYFCGESLERPLGIMGTLRYGSKWLVIAVAVAAAGSFLLLSLFFW